MSCSYQTIHHPQQMHNLADEDVALQQDIETLSNLSPETGSARRVPPCVRAAGILFLAGAVLLAVPYLCSKLAELSKTRPADVNANDVVVEQSAAVQYGTTVDSDPVRESVGPVLGEAFEFSDMNHDGVVTKEEWSLPFDHFDLNHDGSLTNDEIGEVREVLGPLGPPMSGDSAAVVPLAVAVTLPTPPPTELRVPEVLGTKFSQTDSNHDGVLTEDEYGDVLFKSEIDHYDLNHDGIITKDEIEAAGGTY